MVVFFRDKKNLWSQTIWIKAVSARVVSLSLSHQTGQVLLFQGRIGGRVSRSAFISVSNGALLASSKTVDSDASKRGTLLILYCLEGPYSLQHDDALELNLRCRPLPDGDYKDSHEVYAKWSAQHFCTVATYGKFHIDRPVFFEA